MIKNRIASMLRYFSNVYSQRYSDSNKWKSTFGRIGANSSISSQAIIAGEKDIFIGEGTTILANCRIQNFYQDNNKPEIHIGNHCYICYFLTILNASNVTIGDNVLIASHVIISSENHGMDPESDLPYMHQPLLSKPVYIADGCWIGEKVIILPGVTIGKKSIIGAGSVVTKSIPDFSIAAGNPAVVIKTYNFESHKWETVNHTQNQF